MTTYFKPPRLTLESNGAFSISGTCLMGILNVTPDSFSDGGKYHSLQEITEEALRFTEAGAQILDIGGESSRPGALPVPLEVELERVIPAIEAIRKYSNVFISIDTTKSEVAQAAILAGAQIINDISACRQDAKMWQVARQHPLILMHMRGEPRTMQEQVVYQDVVTEVYTFFEERLALARTHGLYSHQIILDPGIGFGKYPEHNLKLLKHLEKFLSLGCPLLVGASRKSFLGKILNQASVKERIMGNAAVTAYCALRGTSILRVHDVLEMQQVLHVINAIEQSDELFKKEN